MISDSPRTSRPAPGTHSPWLVVVRRLAPEGRRLGVVFLLLVGATALPLAGPQLVSRFVDAGLARHPQRELAAIAVAYLAVVLSGQALRVASSYLASGVAWRTTNRLREALAAHAVYLDMDYHGKHTPGEMVERVDGDLHHLTLFLTGFVAEALAGALLLIGTLLLTWLVDARLGASLTLLVVGGGAVLLAAQRRVVPHATAMRQAVADMYGSIEERLVAVDEVRANGAGAHVLRRFDEDAARVMATDIRWTGRSGVVFGATNFLFAAGTALMIGEGILLRQAGLISLGTIILLFQYAQMARNPVEQIVGQAKQLHEAGAAATRLGALLSERPTITWPTAARAEHLPDHGPLTLRLSGVTFAYNGGPPVLRGLDLEVAAGRSLGLVGPTGSGKTTIARLLFRLYDPQTGSVELGGVDLRRVARPDLRARARLITQDVHLFTATLRENVSLFDEGVTDAAIDAALAEVGLSTWRESLPHGLDTVVGAGSVGLSAGESQLLALSRCLVADPGLIVLDEPSSRLDPATEARVRVAIQRLLAGRTAVVIAHRETTLAAVEEVAVMQAGAIVERGSHDELIHSPESRYASLFSAREAG